MAAVANSLAPEIGEGVRDAQEKLRRAMQIANLHNDPLGAVIEAQIATLDAQYTLAVSGVQQIAEAKQPINSDEMRRAVIQGVGAHASRLVGILQTRNVLMIAGILVLTLIVGAGSGYWFGRSTEAAKYVRVPDGLEVALKGPAAADWVALMRLNDITRSNRVCSAQAGGVACSISLWVKPPTAP